MDVCGVTAFVAFMGRWRCTFDTWVLFCFCVSPGLAYWGSGFSHHEPLLSELGVQLGGPFGLAWGLIVGGREFASHRGVTLSRGWLCKRRRPLDTPGTKLH